MTNFDNSDVDIVSKYLPLRHHSQKPVLKYNTGISNNQIHINHTGIPLFSPRQQTTNSSVSVSTGNTNGPNINGASRSLQTPVSFTLTTSRCSTGRSSKGRTNPYSRPISAHEVKAPRVNDTTVNSKKSSATQNQPIYIYANRQSNIFLQPSNPSDELKKPITRHKPQIPQSSTSMPNPPMTIDSKVGTNRVLSPRPRISGSGESQKENIEKTTTLSRPLLNMSPYKLAEEQTVAFRKKKSDNISKLSVCRARQSLMTLFGENSQVAKTAEKLLDEMQKSSSPLPTSSVASSLQSSSSSTIRYINTVAPIKSDSTGKIITKPSPPSSVKPGLTLSTRVRNLNYTPTKPYIEVSEQSGVYFESQTEQNDDLVQSKNSFYRKGSKAEEILIKMKARNEHLSSTPLVKEEKVEESKAVEHQNIRSHEKRDYKREEIQIENIEKKKTDLKHANDEEYEDDIGGEDVLDNIDDDYDSGEDDNGSESPEELSQESTSVRMKLKSSTKKLLGYKNSRPSTASSESSVQQALTSSCFPNVPPTINFVSDGDKVELLPWNIRKHFKWRISTITPNVVKHAIFRSNFRITKKEHDWLGYWGKHMKAPAFKTIRPYQKVNHFPGSFQIGRKDRLWRNLSKLQSTHGKKEFGFFPQTYVLPIDMKLLKRAWEEGASKHKWIIKPPASARGIGIKVVHKWNQIPKKRPVIVQRYLSNPFLINESKFDLRVYVYVTCFDPLRIYVYDDGLTRFASRKYSQSVKNLADKFMHLTNYSINKRNSEYTPNSDENQCQGHKWSLKGLWSYLKRRGIQITPIWESIKDLVIKTIISCESCVNILTKSNVKSRFSCHELFGFDVMLDNNLKPWIIEVNISPSLHSNSQLDMNIKGEMIKDLLNLSGFQLPDRLDTSGTESSNLLDRDTGSKSTHLPKKIVQDKRLWNSSLSSDEKAKHAYYCQRINDEVIQATVLDNLTPDDVRILIDTIDENERRGSFERVFPSENTAKYLAFLDSPRYYNLLLNSWIRKYANNSTSAISHLISLAEAKFHLQTSGSDHQWVPPTRVIGSTRVTR
ncbi:DgyrCDS6006 [Dimorphilus gyrociliatus]|uniref:DgyrCDS6006 n=1 Tax=Dimorphilus gyrociliatus TaxID=2664684 RepID=A0A7I8VNB3_9ANNE|nr:DgyrCDS6006 [Dimorphilus gyrociliatus]